VRIHGLCKLGHGLSPWHLQREWDLQPEHEVMCSFHLFKHNRRLCGGVHGPGDRVRIGELLRRAGVPGWDVRDRAHRVRSRLLLRWSERLHAQEGRQDALWGRWGMRERALLAEQERRQHLLQYQLSQWQRMWRQ
jgi:hypothetical protein